MTPFADVERDFAGAVLDADAAVPSGLTRRAGGVPARRFGVYRNNVYVSLVDLVAGRFPVVARLVGEEFFRAMARVYVEREPPASAVLIHYGTSFADFIAGFAPAASVPYLADTAALEWAWHKAYHAADAEPLALQELAGAAGRAGEAVLTLHPSLGVVRSSYPIVSIVEAHAQSGEATTIQLTDAEDALVARPRLEVEIRHLAPGGACFILALKQGHSIEQAASAALTEAPDFDLTANLAGLFASSVITDIRFGADRIRRRALSSTKKRPSV
jgi:hypothetical protein